MDTVARSGQDWNKKSVSRTLSTLRDRYVQQIKTISIGFKSYNRGALSLCQA